MSRSQPNLPKLIGVIHLRALPGAPGAAGLHPTEALAQAGEQAVREAVELQRAGFEGLILENFGDIPFFKTRVSPETIASLSVIAAAVCESVRIPVGINVLRNDAFSALAIAAVNGASFIRVNVLSGVAATDQGLVEGEAAELLRARAALGADDVEILADVLVKHATTLSTQDLELAIEEAALRAGASGVIVTGPTTGRPAEPQVLETASKICRKLNVPLWVGSGALPEHLPTLRALVDGVIVGSAIRKRGVAGEPLDPKRTKEFVSAWAKAKSKSKKKNQIAKPRAKKAKRK